MENRQIVFTEKNKAELLTYGYPSVGDNEILVKTAYSTISCGTEKANITGDVNVSPFTDAVEEAVFPRFSGYSSAGEVIAVGKAVTKVSVGDRVALSWSQHKEFNCLPEDKVAKIEYDNVSLQAAALCHIGTFPLAAIRKTALEVGESGMVMGLGVLGLMAVMLLKAAGAVPVIAVDPVKERREKALKLGADYALDPFEEGFAEKVRELSFGGINAAIEVTGIGAGLNQCLDCMKPFGRVALLGCTRDRNFTVDYYRKIHGPGVSVIGAHTLARPVYESSPHSFTLQDDMQTLLRLAGLGRLKLDALVDEVHAPAACPEIYNRLINDRNFPTVVQFDWSLL